IEIWELDQASFQSCKRFVARCQAEIPRLDYVFLNAGVQTTEFTLTEDGWETTIQVNGLATALLATLLLPNLVAQVRAGGTHPDHRPHICITASGMHAVAPLTEKSAPRILSKLNERDNFYKPGMIGPDAYPTSKLINVYTA